MGDGKSEQERTYSGAKTDRLVLQTQGVDK